jgi:hypothetical protein
MIYLFVVSQTDYYALKMGTTMSNPFCIYCKSSGSSREHVAPSSIGGNCIVAFVCKPCNTELSVVDQALADHSPITLSKILHTPNASFATHLGGHASFRDNNGRDISVRIGNQMQIEVRPQLILVGNLIQATAADRIGLESLIGFIDKKIDKQQLLNTRVVQNEEANPHLTLHRKNDAVVACSEPAHAHDFLKLLLEQWTELKYKLRNASQVEQTTNKPEVTINLTLRPNDEFRGVAKIAFETTALLFGPAFALALEFDPVRDYIRGDVRLPDSAPGDVAVDTRFVSRINEADFDLMFTSQHGVLLYFTPPELIAFVLLYGTHPYLVRLARLPLESQFLRVYEFSYSRSGHGEVTESEFSIRLVERIPDRLGIAPELIAKVLKELRKES